MTSTHVPADSHKSTRTLASLTILILLLLTSQLALAQSLDTSFIDDVTVADDTVMPPGSPFIKTWRLKNTGDTDWTESYSVALVDGDPLGAASPQPLPLTSPGATANISIVVQAPENPGTYSSYWQLQADTGAFFGSRFYVRIIVPGAELAWPANVTFDLASILRLIPATVTHVVDGDSIDVSIDGQPYAVRYVGIDSPDTRYPINGLEPFGPEGTDANRQLVEGQTVYLEGDVSETDKYDRLLRYVYLPGGLMVNAVLV